MRHFVATLVIVTLVSTTAAQEKLVEARDEGVKDFGSTVTTLPDLTDDGVPEFATGSSSAIGSGRVGSPPGYAIVISLGTMNEILYAEGRQSGGGSFGWSAANLGDVTGDDVPELIVGEPGVFGTAPGAAWVIDGKTGQIIDDMSVQDTQGTGNLGLSVCCLGDVCALAEVAVGVRPRDLPNSQRWPSPPSRSVCPGGRRG